MASDLSDDNLSYAIRSLSSRVDSLLLGQYPVIENDPIDFDGAFLDGCSCDMCQKVHEMITVRDRKTLVTPAQVEELKLHENFGPSFDMFFRES